MPTPALPILRKLDSIRYWALRNSQEVDEVAKLKEFETDSAYSVLVSPVSKGHDFVTGASNSAYLRVGIPIRLARDNSDILVVGLVLLFLVIVVVVELVERLIEG